MPSLDGAQGCGRSYALPGSKPDLDLLLQSSQADTSPAVQDASPRPGQGAQPFEPPTMRPPPPRLRSTTQRLRSLVVRPHSAEREIGRNSYTFGSVQTQGKRRDRYPERRLPTLAEAPS